MAKLFFAAFLALSTPAFTASLPEEITAEARFVSMSSPTIIDEEDGSVVAVFMNTVEGASYSFDPKDFVNLKGAATKEFLAPVLGNCVLQDYSFDYLGSSSIFSVGGRDAAGEKDCQRFMRAVAHGFTMKFTDVPLLNRNGVIKTLVVTVR